MRLTKHQRELKARLDQMAGKRVLGSHQEGEGITVVFTDGTVIEFTATVDETVDATWADE